MVASPRSKSGGVAFDMDYMKIRIITGIAFLCLQNAYGVMPRTNTTTVVLAEDSTNAVPWSSWTDQERMLFRWSSPREIVTNGVVIRWSERGVTSAWQVVATSNRVTTVRRVGQNLAMHGRIKSVEPLVGGAAESAPQP